MHIKDLASYSVKLNETHTLSLSSRHNVRILLDIQQNYFNIILKIRSVNVDTDAICRERKF